VDVIVAGGGEAPVRASRPATTTIPIVIVAIDYDPVAHPSGGGVNRSYAPRGSWIGRREGRAGRSGGEIEGRRGSTIDLEEGGHPLAISQNPGHPAHQPVTIDSVSTKSRAEQHLEADGSA
jgi:hypothetical protein